MATSKTKGTSRKIKELKGIKPEKITDDQLKSVQNLINVINRNQLEIGSMEIKKHEMMHQIAGLRDGLTVLQKEFEEEYGTFDINIQNGTIKNITHDGTDGTIVLTAAHTDALTNNDELINKNPIRLIFHFEK